MNESQQFMDMVERKSEQRDIAYLPWVGEYEYRVYSNSQYPPHFDIVKNGRTVLQGLIPQDMPRSIDDIVFLHIGDKALATDKLKREILSNLQSDAPWGDSNYWVLRDAWNCNNPDRKIIRYDYSLTEGLEHE